MPSGRSACQDINEMRLKEESSLISSNAVDVCEVALSQTFQTRGVCVLIADQ